MLLNLITEKYALHSSLYSNIDTIHLCYWLFDATYISNFRYHVGQNLSMWDVYVIH